MLERLGWLQRFPLVRSNDFYIVHGYEHLNVSFKSHLIQLSILNFFFCSVQKDVTYM